MKHRILFIISLVFLSLNLMAQNVNNIVLFDQSGERFYLILNGVRQNIDPETNVKVVNLDQPSYKLKVIYENKSLPNVDKTLYFPGFGKEYVFQVVNKKGKYKIGYVSEASIKKDAAAAPDQKIIYYGQPADTIITTTTTTTTTTTNPVDNNVNVTTTDNTSSTTTNSTVNTSTTTTNTDGISINVNDDGVKVDGIGINVNVQTTGTNTNTNVTGTTTNNTTTTDNNAVSSDNSSRFLDNGTMCSAPSLTSQQFVKLKFAIDERSLVTKMDVAKDNIKANCMEAAQVAELVKLFKYSSDQLELAKFAYQYTYDTKNYDLVVNALSHEYNKPKLLAVIGTSGSTTTTTNTNVNTNNTTSTTTTTVVEEKVITTGTTNTTTATNQGCYAPMSDDDFATAKKSIESKSFEDSRMTLAKQIMKNKCLSVKQVKEIMLLFSFEQTRLDFAKLAYDYTYDKDNYYQLNDAFTFESSIDDLNEYLESK